MSAVEVVEGRRTLDELAEIANREHEAAEHSAMSALEHGFRAGAAIWEAHNRIESDSEWSRWLSENLTFGRTRACSYERVFALHRELPPEAFQPYRARDGRLVQPSIHRAAAMLRGLPQLRPSARGATPDDVAEMRRLRGAGATQYEIAALMGFTQTTVQKWTTPGAAEKRVARNRARRAELAASRRALQREREATAARKAAGGLSEVYSQTRKSLQILGHELDRAEDTPKVRREINALISELHAVEDHIVRVIKMGGDS